MKYKAVIFDLDGVICHTDKYHYEAWKTIADALGIYFDKEINNRLRGVSRMESLDIVLERYKGYMGQEEREVYAEKKNEIYKEQLKNMSRKDLSPEVQSTLELLQKAGLKLAIGSSSKNAKFILEQLGLSGFFDGISDGNMIANSKPDPEVFLKAAEIIGEKPKDCIVVEDARAGIEAALRANMDCAAIGDAASSGSADFRLKKFSDLLNIVIA